MFSPRFRRRTRSTSSASHVRPRVIASVRPGAATQLRASTTAQAVATCGCGFPFGARGGEVGSHNAKVEPSPSDRSSQRRPRFPRRSRARSPRRCPPGSTSSAAITRLLRKCCPLGRTACRGVRGVAKDSHHESTHSDLRRRRADPSPTRRLAYVAPFCPRSGPVTGTPIGRGQQRLAESQGGRGS
jgi:hypothetical protein